MDGLLKWVEIHPGLVSWVQGIGSIRAVLAALGVVLLQHWLDGRRRQRSANEAARRIITLARDFGHSAYQAIGDVDAYRSDETKVETPAQRRATHARIEQIRRALEDLPLHEFPSAQSATSSLLFATRWNLHWPRCIMSP